MFLLLYLKINENIRNADAFRFFDFSHIRCIKQYARKCKSLFFFALERQGLKTSHT